MGSLPFGNSDSVAADAQKTEAELAEEADAEILAAIANRRVLASDRELAKGIKYTESLQTSCAACLLSLFLADHYGVFSWRPPRHVRERSEEENQKIREKHHIIVDGDNVPPPIANFTACLPIAAFSVLNGINCRT